MAPLPGAGVCVLECGGRPLCGGVTPSSAQLVMDLVARLPEDISMQEMARKIELLAGLQTAREQARRAEGIPAEEMPGNLYTWASQ